MTANLTKSKRRRTLLPYITDFYSPLHFEFETTRAFKDCVAYVERAGSIYIDAKNPRLRPEISKIDDANYEFTRPHRVFSRGPLIEMRGQLQQKSKKLTKVSGVVATNRGSSITLTILFIFSIIISVFPIAGVDDFARVILLGSIVVYPWVAKATTDEKTK